MFPSDVAKRLSLSSMTAPKDQSLLTLRFPKKLWKIVNECKSGAISWSSDGNAVVINYSKFQTDYLDNRLDIFKTSNITSFIRQLNLYGFRKVSPHYKVSVGNPDNADIHIFRNDSFIRGRPDLLQGVTRKTGALRSRMLHHKDEPPVMQSSSSSSRAHQVSVDGARIMQCQGRNFSSRHRQMALRHAISRQHDVLARFGRHCIPGSSGKASFASAKGSNGRVNGLMHGMPWYTQDSTNETTSSEDDYMCGAYRPSDDVAEVIKKIKNERVEEALEDVESEYGGSLLPIAPKIPRWAAAGDCGLAAGASENVFQHHSSQSSGSPSPALSGAGDMGQLLDPTKSPKIALHQNREGERDRTPPLEDSFTLESVLSRMDKSLSEKIYCILMTEDKKDDSVGMAKEITGALGTAHATRVRHPGEWTVDVVDGAAVTSLISSWEADEASGALHFKKCPTSGSGNSTAPMYCV